MLTAPPRPGSPATPSVGVPRAPGHAGVAVRVGLRRRRTFAVLVASLLLVGVSAASSGSGGLRWATLGVALVTCGYAALVRRLRRISVEREMDAAFARSAPVDWDAFARELATGATDHGADATPEAVVPQAVVPEAVVTVSHADLVRFVGSWALGVVLTPVVVAYRLAGGDLSDLERNGVIDRLARLQQQGRSQSLKVLAAGVVATAGVTTVGGMVSVASASPALSARVGGTYTVRAGDTLATIASSHGTTVRALAAANRIADVNLIMVGQSLLLPAGATATTPSSASAAGDPSSPTSSSYASSSYTSSSYTVRAGDTLGSIAADHATTVAALASANGIADPNLIVVGQQLSLGGGPAVATSGTGAGAGSSGTYTVRAGDTLGAVAARFGATVSALAARNHLSDPNALLVGQVLTLSGPAPTAPSTSGSSPAGSSPSSRSSHSTTSRAASSHSTATSAGSGAAATAVSVARQQLGVPYVWAGAAPSGFDCSGLVMYAYAAAGIALPHYTVTQYADTARVSAGQLQPGDLVFYGGSEPGHVAMYVGAGQVISANSPGTVVQIQSIGYDGPPTGYGRVG